MIRRTRVGAAFALLASLPGVASAQGAPDCSWTTLPPFPSEPSGLVVDAIEGQAVYAPAGGEFPWGGISGACIAVVGVETRAIASRGQTGDAGSFNLAKPSAGEYALIVAHPEFDGLVVRLRIRDNASGSAVPAGVLFRLSDKENDLSRATAIERLDLRRELKSMLDADQAVRNDLIRAGMAAPDPEIQARASRLDAANTSRLLEIVVALRWPDLDLVGHDGADAAFTLLQHAEYDVQKQLYPLLTTAYETGQASAQSYALLTDRILTREGKPQIYGTQARPTEEWVNGEPVFYEIEDEANVDRRRAEVGMPPLAEYAALMRSLYFPPRDAEPAPPHSP